MAISLSVLDSGAGTWSSSSFSTGSVSPAANALILAIVVSRFSADPGLTQYSVSGNGLTWVRVSEISVGATSGRSVAIFRAMGGSPSAGAVTFSESDPASTTGTAAYKIIQATGVDTSGTNGSGAISGVTTTDNGSSGATSIGLTIGASPTGSDVTFLALGAEDFVSGVNGDALWAELGTTVISSDALLRTDYDDGQDVSPTLTFNGGTLRWAALIAFDLVAATGGGPTGPPAGSLMSMGVGV